MNIHIKSEKQLVQSHDDTGEIRISGGGSMIIHSTLYLDDIIICYKKKNEEREEASLRNGLWPDDSYKWFLGYCENCFFCRKCWEKPTWAEKDAAKWICGNCELCTNCMSRKSGFYQISLKNKRVPDLEENVSDRPDSDMETMKDVPEKKEEICKEAEEVLYENYKLKSEDDFE